MIYAVNWRSIILAAAAIVGLPTVWNIIARNEYRRHTIERLTGGKRRGAYLFAAWIFTASSLRDAAFHHALGSNPPSRVLPLVPATSKHALQLLQTLKWTGVAFVACGTGLVISSFLRLGLTGTYLGDYFGIRMKKRVITFPFSHFKNPMYLGATMNFIGASLMQNSGVGLLLTVWVGVVYCVTTIYFEDPFTNMIYAENSDPQKKQLSI